MADLDHTPPDSANLPASEKRRPKLDEEQVGRHVRALKDLHVERRDMRRIIRDICDGGPGGLAALFGDDVQSMDWRLPVANYILSGIERRAEKLGVMPGLKVDPAREGFASESERAEKRENIVRGYDDISNLQRNLKQQGLWLPGYGFCPWVVWPKWWRGYPYPTMELRDPFNAFPGEFVAGGQPENVAFIRTMNRQDVARIWPNATTYMRDAQTGGVVLASRYGASSDAGSGWENRTGSGVEIAEYWCADGVYIIMLDGDRNDLLDFVPNLIDGRPLFHIVQRVVFNQLRGEFDEVVGLQGADAKLNLLIQIATEDAVFAPYVRQTSNPGQPFEIGRFAVNDIEPGGDIKRISGGSINPQLFMQTNNLEDQLRTTANYSEIEDGQSPAPWATDRGLGRLEGAGDRRITWYFDLVKESLEGPEALDGIRLQMDEALEERWGVETKPIPGSAGGTDTYRASSDIDGRHQTRREYGYMAGWDEPNKISTAAILKQLGVLDTQTIAENLSGIRDVAEVLGRVQRDRALDILGQSMAAKAQEGDERATLAMLAVLDGKPMHEAIKKFYSPDEGDDPSAQQQAMIQQMLAAQGQGPPGQNGGGPPPDVATVLNRITPSGPMSGVQTVGRLG